MAIDADMARRDGLLRLGAAFEETALDEQEIGSFARILSLFRFHRPLLSGSSTIIELERRLEDEAILVLDRFRHSV